jgi:hypothetical protein
MSELREDSPLDDWSRLRRRLRQMTESASEAVLAGGCTHDEYLAHCARYQVLQEVLSIASEIRRGDDLKQAEPSAVGSWLKSVEE